MTTDQSTPQRSDALALPKADKAGWSDIDVRAVDTTACWPPTLSRRSATATLAPR